MTTEAHLQILLSGNKAWNSWRATQRGIRPQLAGADLREFDLRGADLSRVDLGQARLTGAYLDGVDLRDANLSAADLRGATLEAADLRLASLTAAECEGADLSGANLSHAYLVGTNLCQSILGKTNLSGALAGKTLFGDLDLSSATGLDQVVHSGPSTIGIDTLVRSRGTVPKAFLRGCGVLDWQIEAAKLYRPAIGPEEITDILYRVHELRVGQPLQFNSCFISHATTDQELATRIYNDLQSRGVRCWYAPHDMRLGATIADQIDRAIHSHDRLLVILSKKSMASDWVKFEVTKAQKREEQENRRILFPLGCVPFSAIEKWRCLNDRGEDIAPFVRRYFIPDFGNLDKDPDKYEQQFERLLNALRPPVDEQAKTAQP